jgi:hypothetical protein
LLAILSDESKNCLVNRDTPNLAFGMGAALRAFSSTAFMTGSGFLSNGGSDWMHRTKSPASIGIATGVNAAALQQESSRVA